MKNSGPGVGGRTSAPAPDLEIREKIAFFAEKSGWISDKSMKNSCASH